MGKSTISMAIFNSFLLVYQRVWFPGILAEPRSHDFRGIAMPSNPQELATFEQAKSHLAGKIERTREEGACRYPQLRKKNNYELNQNPLEVLKGEHNV